MSRQATHARGIALDVTLAIDFDQAAIDTYRRNFPKATTDTAAVEMVFGGGIGDELTFTEQAVREKLGSIHALVGGPPCQGHSDLNNVTRRVDPKNTLYLRMVRAAEVLQPRVVLIENVPAVRHSKPMVVEPTADHLREQGYLVADAVVAIDRLGVAQRRRRHLMLAVAPDLGLEPSDVLTRLASASEFRDVRWAIGDLVGVDSPTTFDTPPRASKANLERMKWMDEHGELDLPDWLRPECHRHGGHSYRSVYGRLRWDEPSRTITSGFSSIGQGRFMHPQELRGLSAHEAARLQGFPDYFEFESATKRTDLATMIGNAVPPGLGKAVFDLVLDASLF